MKHYWLNFRHAGIARPGRSIQLHAETDEIAVDLALDFQRPGYLELWCADRQIAVDNKA